MPECDNCYHIAKYSMQNDELHNVLCKGCLIDSLEVWEDKNKDKIIEGDVDFIVFRVILSVEHIFLNDVAERIQKNYGLIIKKFKEEI